MIYLPYKNDNGWRKPENEKADKSIRSPEKA